jgi:hypothetical protein
MSNNYRVRVNSTPNYRLGVNYEIPTKAQQYNNIILDDISGGFTGIAKTFTLYDNGTLYTPASDQQLIVSRNDVVLEPSVDYITSGTSIVFTTAPSPGDDVWINALVTTADLTRTINMIVDSGSLAMTPGNKGSLTLDVVGSIASVTVLSDQTGSVRVDIKKSNYSTYPTFTSIVGSSYPQITNSNKYFDDVLSGWTKSFTAGDIFQFEVIYSINITRFVISLKLNL